jgi:glycosyltransferase involved in cell wall biosynthesis
MNFLFVHQNFPGQYLHLAKRLAADPGNRVVFITQRKDGELPGVTKIVYRPGRQHTKGVHHYLRETESGVLNAQAVMRIALELKQSGFVPDLMLGHNGWGEIWYLKDVFPNSPLLGYFEFYYRFEGADVGFDRSATSVLDDAPRLRTKNLGNLVGLAAADAGQCPTNWQKSVYPARYHDQLQVIHEGIDTNKVRPDAQAWLKMPKKGITLSHRDEVLTYVARNLEPYRGFPSLMRSLPRILQSRPKAHVLIVGGNETSYGPPPPNGKTFRDLMLAELADSIDMSRVHFLGKVPYSIFLKILQVSTAHVYLTYPFVLSWSMLEAMSAGCLVIGSRTQPVQEVIRDGENGILVDFFQPDDIADRVVEALANREAFAEIRAQARNTVVENYDLETICLPTHLRLVQDLTARKERR